MHCHDCIHQPFLHTQFPHSPSSNLWAVMLTRTGHATTRTGPSLQGPGQGQGLDRQGQGLDSQGPGQGQGLKFGP